MEYGSTKSFQKEVLGKKLLMYKKFTHQLLLKNLNLKMQRESYIHAFYLFNKYVGTIFFICIYISSAEGISMQWMLMYPILAVNISYWVFYITDCNFISTLNMSSYIMS